MTGDLQPVWVHTWALTLCTVWPHCSPDVCPLRQYWLKPTTGSAAPATCRPVELVVPPTKIDDPYDEPLISSMSKDWNGHGRNGPRCETDPRKLPPPVVKTLVPTGKQWPAVTRERTAVGFLTTKPDEHTELPLVIELPPQNGAM